MRPLTTTIALSAAGLAAAALSANDLRETIWSLCLASAPAGPAPSLWVAWSLAPAVVLPLAVLAVWHVHTINPAEVTTWRPAAFVAGYAALVLALVSPLCRMAAMLSSAHMVQHVLLVAVGPPLLLLGMPSLLQLFGAVRRLGLTVWTLLYGATIWAWHAPLLYEAALLHPMMHLLLYASLLAVSFGFWTNIIARAAASTEGTGAVLIAMLLTLVHTGFLGALLTFSARPWYPVFGLGSASWGLSPLEDQQLAGLIMWVPMGMLYAIAALVAIGHRLGKLHEPPGIELLS